MSIVDSTQDVMQRMDCLSRAAIQNIESALKYAADDLGSASAEDADLAARAKWRLASAGLELTQRLIPSLQALGENLLEVAGRDTVIAVCTPPKREGTDCNGKPYRTVAEYELPPQYESLATKAAGVVTAAGATAVALVIGAATLLKHSLRL